MLRNLTILISSILVWTHGLQAADGTQTITVNNALQIPGASLNTGSYEFSVEDRLPDRAIVRVTNSQAANEHYLLLAVPSTKTMGGAGEFLVFFHAAGDKKALKAWNCPACDKPLEFVYPKAEAIKITGDSAEAVLAVDPSHDKLPTNLTPDDMKVVTLWLLSPERITADNIGQGVKAVKYSADGQPVAPQATAAATVTEPTPAASAPASTEIAGTAPTPTLTASAVPPRRHLPKTATNNGLFALIALTCFGGALALRVGRRRRA